MSNKMIDKKPLKTAKEYSYHTVNYHHSCPYCGDEPDGYETSVVGDVLECICGEKYKVVK